MVSNQEETSEYQAFNDSLRRASSKATYFIITGGAIGYAADKVLFSDSIDLMEPGPSTAVGLLAGMAIGAGSFVRELHEWNLAMDDRESSSAVGLPYVSDQDYD